MNYFKAAEQVLSSVPTLKQALENLERRKQRLINSGVPADIKAIDYSKPFTDSKFVDNTLNELLEVTECTRNITSTQNEIEYIESVVNQLSDEHKKVVNLWYIKKIPKEQIAQELCVESNTTVYKLRNKAVAEFALLYYGARALSSI